MEAGIESMPDLPVSAERLSSTPLGRPDLGVAGARRGTQPSSTGIGEAVPVPVVAICGAALVCVFVVVVPRTGHHVIGRRIRER
jgi:hypothetical protein